MSILLHVEPLTSPLNREQFIERCPRNSVALDGYVYGAPWFDVKKKYANWNHHELVNRLATRATCAQVLLAIRMGFFSAFPYCANNELHIYVNDCDEDVCLSVFFLMHEYIVKSPTNPAVNKINSIEDVLDATAGSYPSPPDEKIAWVFDPYRKFRLLGGLERKNAEEYASVITDVGHRIMQYIVGNAGSVAIDTRYERLGGGRGWIMCREVGNYAKSGVFGDGYQACLSVRQRPDNKYVYAFSKMTFFPLDLIALFDKLNTLENLTTSEDQYGGGETVGGSPRVGGSNVKPDQMQDIVNEMLC